MTTDRTKDKIDLAAVKARTVAHNVVDKTAEAAGTVGEKVVATAKAVGDKLEDAGAVVKDAAKNLKKKLD